MARWKLAPHKKLARIKGEPVLDEDMSIIECGCGAVVSESEIEEHNETCTGESNADASA